MTFRQLRRNSNITQIVLANSLGISQEAISLYENNLRQPDISLLPKLAKVLKCSIEDIVYCFCDKGD